MRSLSSRPSNNRAARRQRGAALLELALVLPLLLLMALVTTEMGRALLYYNTLTKSVRDAVRYLSVQTPGTKTLEARNLMVYGSLTATGTPLVPGLTLAQVPEPVWQQSGSNPLIQTVTVRINGYTFRSMVGQVGRQTLGNFTFSEISASMRTGL